MEYSENQHEKELIEKKKEKIKAFFENKEMLFLLGIFTFAIVIRLYYFFVTNGQPLWWDEAEYMSAAKSFAGIVDYHLGGNRLPGFPLLMSIFFIFNIANETLMRFVGLLIPSLIVIFLTYFTIKEMYPDKRVALISTLFMTVLWEHLFYSNRFQTENFALIFQFLATFILFKCYIKKEKLKFIKPKFALIWILAFSLIAVFFRPGNFLFIPATFLFIIIINQSFLFRKKTLPFWMGALILIVIPWFTTNIYQKILANYYNAGEKLAWSSLTVFKGFFPSTISWIPQIIYYLFLLGIIFVLIDLLLRVDYFKHIKNNQNNLELKSDIFNLLTILAVLGFFIFFLRSQAYEFRWFFSMLLGMLSFTSKGIITFADYSGKLVNSKKLSIFLIILIVLIGVHSQLQYSDFVIKSKTESYLQVKQAGLWLKDNSFPEDVIVSASIPQNTFYSERKTRDFYVNGFNDNETIFFEMANDERPKYLVVSAFEPGFTPQWAYSVYQNYPEKLIPIQTFSQPGQSQPLLVIFEFNYQ